MLSYLRSHPFAVQSHFDTSLVLTYAFKKEQIDPLIPECLQLDTFNDEWAFIAIAMVQTRKLRPRAFPEFLGNDFFLAGYRIFVRYDTSYGKRLRGLFILGSETDKPRMSFFGNIFTHYNYQTTDIDFRVDGEMITVNSTKSDLNVKVKTHRGDVALPKTSPFKDWKEARRFAGPLPFTFTFDKEKSEVLIIEGVREAWTPQPVEVIHDNIGFINKLKIPGGVLANAFVIHNIPYHWKKGRKDKWIH